MAAILQLLTSNQKAVSGLLSTLLLATDLTIMKTKMTQNRKQQLNGKSRGESPTPAPGLPWPPASKRSSILSRNAKLM